MIVIPEYSRCRVFFYFVGRDERGDNENENYEKHACSKFYNILQVFMKSKKTVDALSLLTEEEEGAVRCIFVHFGTLPPTFIRTPKSA